MDVHVWDTSVCMNVHAFGLVFVWGCRGRVRGRVWGRERDGVGDVVELGFQVF